MLPSRPACVRRLPPELWVLLWAATAAAAFSVAHATAAPRTAPGTTEALSLRPAAAAPQPAAPPPPAADAGSGTDAEGCAAPGAEQLGALGCGVTEHWQCAWNLTEAALVAAAHPGVPSRAQQELQNGARAGRPAAAAREVLRAYDNRGLTKDAVRRLRDIEAHASEAAAAPAEGSCGVVIFAGASDSSALAVTQAKRIRACVPGVPLALAAEGPVPAARRAAFDAVVTHRPGAVPAPAPFDRALILAPGVVPNAKVGRGPTLQGLAGLLGLLRWHDLLAPAQNAWDWGRGGLEEQPLEPRVLAMRRSRCTEALRRCWAQRAAAADCPASRFGCGALRDALRRTPAKYASVSQKWRWESRPGEQPSTCLDKHERAKVVFIDS
eukprot:TRINITY_DN25211_c0_g1_i2.p1 TRINITY_DN25211_c0_g1~~TRINITY_DN25211_c0_g1_i2.p1  ORF type:complete len:410 (+),score=101.03 TRINITY_DN25211_c0_g1_i2:85-1230(+)